MFIKTRIITLVAAGMLMTFSAEAKEKAGKVHPNTAKWDNLFKPDLSDAAFPKGIWTFGQGILTASEDQAIWSAKEYKKFILDLEFKTADGTNSGVIVYCTNKENWIPNSVEIQIADDFAKKWAESPKT
jgi:hypothetical protein